MLHTADYAAAVLILVPGIAQAIQTCVRRYWARRVILTLSLTEWKSFHEILVESGCRPERAKRMLFAGMIADVLEYHVNLMLDYEDPELRERVDRIIEDELDIETVEFLEFRLKRIAFREKEEAPSFEVEPDLVPMTI